MAPVITGLKKNVGGSCILMTSLLFVQQHLKKGGGEILERVLNSTNPFFLSFYSSGFLFCDNAQRL